VQAGIKAVECLDAQLRRLVPQAREKGYEVIITADHGNAEEMYNISEDFAHTAHTTNPVPFILISDMSYQLKAKGSLTNVAPTALKILGLEKPKEMEEGLIE
jgi:2,3-bisphosphoglycerate-independent phosphoglycerate mutase